MDNKTLKEMIARATQFQRAMKSPDKRLGKHKKIETVSAPIPRPAPKSFKRFEQLNKKDGFDTTTFNNDTPEGMNKANSGGHINVHVEDHEDSKEYSNYVKSL